MATRRLTDDDDNNTNDDVVIDIPADELLGGAAGGVLGNSRKLARALFLVGLYTLVTVLTRFVHIKLPPGAIFEGHLLAYYLVLFGILLAGMAEVYAAVLLYSAQDNDGGRGRPYAMSLFIASIVLLAAAIVLGGGTPSSLVMD